MFEECPHGVTVGPDMYMLRTIEVRCEWSKDRVEWDGRRFGEVGEGDEGGF